MVDCVSQAVAPGVPGIMNSDRTHFRSLIAPQELPVESARINGRAVTTREGQRRHVLRLLPDLAGSHPFALLLRAPDGQCRNDNLRHRQPSIGCLGFGFALEEGPTDSLQLMIRHKCAVLEVDCLPCQA